MGGFRVERLANDGQTISLASPARAMVLCLALLALWAWPQCRSLASPLPRGSFGLFRHTGWTQDDGAPTPIDSAVRGADGFLYVGSGRDGLYRFDGFTFEKVPDTPIAASRRAPAETLLVSREGEIWVGYAESAGVGVMRHGRMLDTGMIDPPSTITELQQTKDGAIWAAFGGHGHRLWRFAQGKWQCMDDLLSLPDGFVTSIAAAPDGTLWRALLSTDNAHGSLFSLPAAGTGLQLQSDAISFGRLSFDPRGRLWVVDRLGIRILRDASGRIPSQPTTFALAAPLRIAHVAFDSAGALWSTTGAGTIFRIASAADEMPSGPVDLFDTGDGLTSNNAGVVAGDDEGNVWVSTDGGLDRFRPSAITRVQSIPADATAGLAIARAKNGEIYVVSNDQLFDIAPHQDPHAIKGGLGRDRAICAAQDGGIWIVGTQSVSHMSTTDLTTFTRATPGAGDGSCAEDRNGRLWIGSSKGLIWHDKAGWHRPTGIQGKEIVFDTLIDQEGNLIFTLKNRSLGILNGNDLRILDQKELDTGPIRSISIGRRDIFVSGHRALVRLRSGTMTRVTVARVPFLDRLRNIIQTEDGMTWMMGTDGISRVATSDLDRAFANADAPLHRQLFNTKDGLPGPWQHIGYLGPQGEEGADGRLWFSTANGLASINPANLPKNPVPPPLAIESLAANGKANPDFDGIRLPPGTSALDIDFAALSLVAPERNHYRYRLDGVEKAWVDPGRRHEASYANLGAGRYVFHLLGANNDGVWSPHEATASFTIEPTFVQSSEFKFLCALVFASLLWLAYSLRLRAVTARIRLGMEERLLERERIARELHDTLLQAIAGLMLRFDVAARTLPPDSPARGRIENALDLADKVIAEGRDRVRDLRADFQLPGFEAALRDVADSLLADDALDCDFSVIGRPRGLDPVAREEALRIIRESLVNAQRHACAHHISIQTLYAPSKFEVSISDDGIGIDPTYLNAGRREGHYGLTGMRERARKLGGTLALERLDRGTRVTLRIPGSVAFAGRRQDTL
jgi:signal transduction histidine kinase/ligand-binding sensor domain-containing protein